ncbi:putative polysaccharide biosynthesis protein [Lutispora thermophila]|uniref:Stage V sporulation protein B n=1 Tax=Lutispora thermophila DSM 19022 TaxID=1122184 RepID=A0A1M6GEN1_9FIRM|nr:polysaccharide biosynthesis protein [Lutispora thermophila]SHJ08402.1 stage V sporulation protein B [Lutispora thermophila DSM 19022]
MENKKHSFIKGALILTIAGLVSKVLGAIYRIPLGQIITSEGMAYHQTAYDLYVLMLTFSSYSIPTAISKLVSERLEEGRRDEAHKIFKVAMGLLATIGLILSVTLYFNADTFTQAFKNPGSYFAVLAVSPAIFTVSISGAFRGYFQGMQNMTPSAVSQVTEQLSRVLVGFLLAYLFLPYGYMVSAAGAIFGTTVGGLVSFITLYIIYRKDRPRIMVELNQFKGKKTEPVVSIIGRIIKFALPIMIGGSIMPIMNLLDTFIVMDRLQAAGFNQVTATKLFGQLKGIATSFVNVPQVFTISLAASLVPSISESMVRKDLEVVRRKSKLALKMSLLLGLPAAMGLFILAGPIMQMFYPNETESLGLALRFVSPAVIFLTLVQTMTGILQGMGKERIPVVNMVIGASAKAVISYVLTSMPVLNINGAALGTVLGYAVAAVLNYRALVKYQKKSLNIISISVKPAIATAVMTVSAYYSHKLFYGFTGRNSIAALLGIFIGVVVYGVVIILIKGVTKEELDSAPGGQKLSKMLKKRGLI